MRILRGMLSVAALLAAFGASGGQLRYAEDRAPGIVSPLFATTMAEVRINELVFEGLYTDDAELRSVPDLAVRHEFAADKSSLLVHLRPNVVWHDGTPFSASDVVFTYEAMKHPKTASPESGRVAFVAGVERVDDLADLSVIIPYSLKQFFEYSFCALITM